MICPHNIQHLCRNKMSVYCALPIQGRWSDPLGLSGGPGSILFVKPIFVGENRLKKKNALLIFH